MKVYTRSFWDVPQGIPAYSVARSQPKNFRLPSITAAFPSWQIIMGHKSGRLTEKTYARLYLECIAMDMVAYSLKDLGMDEVVICCWEKKGDFCHRRILAEELKKRGFEVDVG